MKVVVTGVAGFIGSHLAERLVSRGDQVLGIDCFTDYYADERKRQNLTQLLDANEFSLIEEDINVADLDRILEDASIVFHLAGQPGVRSSWGEEFSVYLDDNVQATQKLLEASRNLELDRFVMASSSSIYGDAAHYPTTEDQTPAPISPYGVTKLAAEHLGRLYWKAHGIPTVGLRYFTIFGPRQRPDMAMSRFIDVGLNGGKIEIYGDGEQIRDFTYVDDCVDATLAAAECGQSGEVYNIAGGSQATVLDVLEILEGLVGHEIHREHMPAMPGDARRTKADTVRAERDLGYAPRVSLAQGIEHQLESQRP